MSYPGSHDHEREIWTLCAEVRHELDVDDAHRFEEVVRKLDEIEKWAVDTLAALWDEARDEGYQDGVESVDACCWDESDHQANISRSLGFEPDDIQFLLAVAREAHHANPDLWSFRSAKADQLRLLLRGS